MTLRSINLNLLPVLQALLREASVSRAARAVGLSQPAASRALAQLRAILGDPLLVRAGSGLVLTPRAVQLRAEVDRACQDVAAIWRPLAFDPAAERRAFVIASADYAPLLLVPTLLPLVQASAPGVTLRFDEFRPADLVDQRDPPDFVLGPMAMLDRYAAADYTAVSLFTDSFVTVVGATHPLATGAPSAVEIDAWPHILFAGGDAHEQTADAEAALIGRRPTTVVARVRHFAVLPMLAVMTGAVTIMPRRIADILARDLPIAIVDEARRVAPVEIGLAWQRRFDTDAAHHWFRTLAKAALAGLPAD